MKKLHQYKINDTHSVVVFDNKSKSNYNRFVIVVKTIEKKTALHGITLKETSTKQDYINYGLYGLKQYQNENNN